MIAKAKPEAEVLKTAGMHLEEIVDVMVDRVKSGKMVARIHTGDPAMYGAIMEQIALLKKRILAYEVIPGVSSVFASAAAIGAELTIPDLTQTLILTRAEGRTPVPEFEKLRDLASHHCTIALFLSATLTKKIVKELQARVGKMIRQLLSFNGHHGQIKKLFEQLWFILMKICGKMGFGSMR